MSKTKEEKMGEKKKNLEFLRGTKVWVAPPKGKPFYAIVKLLPREKYSIFTVKSDAIFVIKFYDHYVAPSKKAEYEVKLSWVSADKIKEDNLKKGDIVKIYEQPLTETKFEGEAKLISFIKRGNIIELWKVKFIDDDQIVTRAIKIKQREIKQ